MMKPSLLSYYGHSKEAATGQTEAQNTSSGAYRSGDVSDA
jgi:hypothetical protein